MKKTMCLGLILASLFVICGCSANELNETIENAIMETDKEQAIVIDEDGLKSEEQTDATEEKEPVMVIGGADDEDSTDDSLTEEEESADDSFFGYYLSDEERNDPRVCCKETAEPGKVIIDFAGDICFDDGYSNMSRFRNNGSTMSGVLSADLLEELCGADIFMVNNEFPYTDTPNPLPGKTFTFKAKPQLVSNLDEMGVDIVSLANNHAYDQGAEGLLKTFSVLEEADVPYVGAGRNIADASKPFYFIAGGMKLAFVSATQVERNDTPDTKEAGADTPGVLRTLDPTKFLSVIEEADSNADITVVYVHWGSENTYEVDASQKELARKYVDAGADLIIGDHSHCLQGFEYVNGVPVVYSLGNFWFNSKDLDTCVVQAIATNGKIEKVRFIPCHQHDCRTDLVGKASADYMRILGVMETLSYDVSIDAEGYISQGAGNGVPAVEPRPVVKPNYAQQTAEPVVDPAAAVETVPENVGLE